jgi:serpin B
MGLLCVVLVGVEILLDPIVGVGPISGGYVLCYNAVQWARSIPTPAAISRRRRAAGAIPNPAVVTAQNGFGLRYLKAATTQHPRANLFFSPYSLSASLALAMNGARGAARTALERALGLSRIPFATTNHAYHEMDIRLNYADPKVQIASANSIWTGASLQPDFTQTASREYGADAQRLDFASPSAPARVNDWIASHTRGRIRNAVAGFGGNERIALVNAVYFHGEWTYKFEKSNTRNSPFHRIGIEPVSAPTMRTQMDAPFHHTHDWAAARLPYGAGGTSMLIVLPRDPDGLPAMVASLTPATWDSMLRSLTKAHLSVTMPRFRMDCRADADRTLKSLGLGPCFEETADFTGISAAGPCWISTVAHQATLNVDEEGATAAAMSMPRLNLASEHMGYPFRVDHPFLCAIMDDATNQALFMGAVYNPSSP